MVTLEIAAAIAAVAFALGIGIGRRSSRRRTVVWREERSRPSSAGHAEIEDAEIDELLRRDQLIAAIKRYRELSGLGLREAKDAMEARRRKLR